MAVGGRWKTSVWEDLEKIRADGCYNSMVHQHLRISAHGWQLVKSTQIALTYLTNTHSADIFITHAITLECFLDARDISSAASASSKLASTCWTMRKEQNIGGLGQLAPGHQSSVRPHAMCRFVFNAGVEKQMNLLKNPQWRLSVGLGSRKSSDFHHTQGARNPSHGSSCKKVLSTPIAGRITPSTGEVDTVGVIYFEKAV